jgi:hypothetical protein
LQKGHPRNPQQAGAHLKSRSNSLLQHEKSVSDLRASWDTSHKPEAKCATAVTKTAKLNPARDTLVLISKDIPSPPGGSLLWHLRSLVYPRPTPTA